MLTKEQIETIKGLTLRVKSNRLACEADEHQWGDYHLMAEWNMACQPSAIIALCDLALSALVPAASAGRQQVAECPSNEEQRAHLDKRLASRPQKPFNIEDCGIPAVAIASPEGEPDYKALHTELIMEVGRRFEGESRHETAKRYIRQTEERASLPGNAKATPSQN